MQVWSPHSESAEPGAGESPQPVWLYGFHVLSGAASAALTAKAEMEMEERIAKPPREEEIKSLRG